MRRIATVKYGSSTPPLERAALKIIFQFDCSDISSHPSSSLPSPTPTERKRRIRMRFSSADGGILRIRTDSHPILPRRPSRNRSRPLLSLSLFGKFDFEMESKAEINFFACRFDVVLRSQDSNNWNIPG